MKSNPAHEQALRAIHYLVSSHDASRAVIGSSASDVFAFLPETPENLRGGIEEIVTQALSTRKEK